MKFLNATLSAVVVSSLIAAPVAAQAASAAASRTASPVAQDEQLAGFGWGWIALIAVLIAAGVIIISDNDENLPTSP